MGKVGLVTFIENYLYISDQEIKLGGVTKYYEKIIMVWLKSQRFKKIPKIPLTMVVDSICYGSGSTTIKNDGLGGYFEGFFWNL